MVFNNLLKNLCWITFFFPFTSPVPINTDLQPFSFIIIFLTIIFYHRNLKYNLLIIILFLFGIISIFYINTSVEYNPIKRFVFFAVLLVVIFIKENINNENIKIVTKILLIHVFLILFQILFPEYFTKLFGHFIRNETFVVGDVRGAHGLNAEPGGASAVLAGIYFYLVIQFNKNRISFSNFPLVILFLTLIGLALTKSGLAIYCTFFILLYHINVFKKDKYIILTFLIIISLYSLSLNEYNRAIGLLVTFWDYGFEILFSDGSIAERILGLSYGIYSLTLSPFGFGGGGYPIASNYVENHYLLSTYFYSAREQIDGTISMTGLYLAEFGILFLFLYIFVMYYFRPKSLSSIPIFILALSFFMFSFSVAFPITWLLFYLVKKNDS